MLKKNLLVNNLDINYYQSEDFHAENSLVFLHGWQAQAEHLNIILSRCKNFIALDLPGFGSSQLPPESWGLGHYARFLNNFLAKLNIKNPILIGHSFGGGVILKYAILGYPAQKLILIDSSGIRKKTFKKIIIWAFAKIFKLVLALPLINKHKEKIKNNLYGKIGASDYLEAGALKQIYQTIIREDLTAELSKISRPTEIIWGMRDADTPLADARFLAGRIKNSRLHLIADAGHWPFLDQPEEFNKIFFNLI